MKVTEIGAQVLMVVAVTCAIAMTVTVIRGQYNPPSQGRGGTRASTAAPAKIADWQKYAAAGHRMGPTDAPVTIIEFGDFQCPACRQFAVKVLKGAQASFPGQIAVVFRHWPLPYHRLAYPTARAAECAAAQGRFSAFYDLAYAEQDSLGLKSYAAFARESGVPDSNAFARCIGDNAPVHAIDEDAKTAVAIGGHGTPLLIINGLVLPGVPDSARFNGIVRDALQKARANHAGL